MTNYDRIKQMSIEEMAKYAMCILAHACTADRPKKCKKNLWKDGLSPCEQCVKQWLEMEVE